MHAWSAGPRPLRLTIVNHLGNTGVCNNSGAPHNGCMLQAMALTCVRGERSLFAGLGFALREGEGLHVRGANGAGKTSLLRLLAGLSRPEAGEVRWRDSPIGATAAAYRGEMLFFGHQAAVKEDLTAAENLTLAAALDGARLGAADAAAALARLGLHGCEELPVRCLSAGQRRRVLLARLLVRRARLWILDEPFTALDAAAIALLASLLGEHLATGGLAVVTSHQPLPLAGVRALDL
jgi:heme exporter protein A